MSKARTNFSGQHGLLAVSSGDGLLIRLPGWTPPGVAREIGIIAAMPLADEAAAILIRLVWDSSMVRVWGELGRQRRGTNEYLHPARPPTHRPPRSPYLAQQAALAETLHFAFRSVIDGRRATTMGEIAHMQAKLLAQAALLRDLAAQTPPNGEVADILEAGALLRRASRLEAEAAEMRGADDPLTVVRHTADPHARGVQIDISSFFLERFGDRLDRTAATLTAVALGFPKHNLRAARSAPRSPDTRS
jgi:hypothetical protein